MDDLRFVLGEMARHNAVADNNPLGSLGGLGGRLDLARVGVWRVGFGGSAAVQLCASEPRCAAAANLDGHLAGVQGGPAPKLDRPCLQANQGQNANAGQPVGQPAFTLALRGAQPLHFSGVALWFPLLAQ